MSMIRKYLQLLCGLMAAAWLLSIAIGIAQGCQLAAMAESVAYPLVQIESASDAHDAADINHHDETCLKHCETFAAGVLTSTPQGDVQPAVLVLAFFLLVLLTTWSTPARTRSTRRYALAIRRDPPATLRFHRFNN